MANSVKKIRETSTGWLLQRLARKSEKAMEANLKRHQLSIQQFAVLMTVLENEGQTQAQIGKRFSMPAYSISRALDGLAKSGLITRTEHPASRRAFVIHPTKKGRDLAPALHDTISAANRELTSELNADEKATLIALLTKIL